MEKAHCLSRKGRELKREMLSPASVFCLGMRAEWGHLCPWTSGLGSCSSSPGVSYKRWTHSDPSVIKGNSLHTQEQLSNECLVSGLERSAGHLLSVPPLPTGHSALNLELGEVKLCSEPWLWARIHRKCTERLQGSYLLSHAIVVYFWCKLWETWEFRHAGCAL